MDIGKCNRSCGYGKRKDIYNIIKKKGEKGLQCRHKTGKQIKVNCINRLCEEGEYCKNNNDCKYGICNIDSRCENTNKCDKNDLIHNCNTFDKCESLNVKYKNEGEKYIWDGYDCNPDIRYLNLSDRSKSPNK